jgi:hypothetical protein
VPEVARAARNLLLTVSSVVLSAWALGCSGADGSSVPDGAGKMVTAPSSGGATATASEACASPAEGCACDHESATAECQGPKIRTGNYTSCQPGERLCSNGTWGACMGKTAVQGAAEVTQDYSSPCASGSIVQWGALALEGLTPGDSQIVVRVQAAGSQEALDTATPILLGSFGGAKETSWTSVGVQSLLEQGGVSDDAWLRVTLVLEQATGGGSLPILAGWQQPSTCALAH